MGRATASRTCDPKDAAVEANTRHPCVASTGINTEHHRLSHPETINHSLTSRRFVTAACSAVTSECCGSGKIDRSISAGCRHCRHLSCEAAKHFLGLAT